MLFVALCCNEISSGLTDVVFIPRVFGVIANSNSSLVCKILRGIILLCLHATLRSGGLEAARQLLHSHAGKLARDVRSYQQAGSAALRK